MTFSDAPLERISNAQELTYATQGNPFIGGKNLCLNLKNLFNQYQGNPLIMLEDDIEVCTDFSTKIEEIINQKPDSVINFFNSDSFNLIVRFISIMSLLFLYI